MIIECPECKKKFEIDNNLIPSTGRLLQCSSCSHKWYFKKEIKEIKKKPVIQRIYDKDIFKDIPKETEEIIKEAEKNNKKRYKKR